uniref:Uncharacterized protein n=1 Tax=Leersia perrieri TaxID=77586 RepID=A0A0D9W4L8_9ORYZ
MLSCSHFVFVFAPRDVCALLLRLKFQLFSKQNPPFLPFSLSKSTVLLVGAPATNPSAAAVLPPGPVMPVLDPGKLPLWSPNCRQPLVLT